MRNPKRRAIPEASRSRWYSYYAGYSDQFVRDALTHLNLAPGARVLDAWNGSGTTTQLAGELGYQAYGFDINPAMVIVAKARLLDHRVHGSLRRLAGNIIRRARQWNGDGDQQNDPLTAWLTVDGSLVFRAFDYAIQQELFDSQGYRRLVRSNLAEVSCLAAFYYVALFRALRSFLTTFLTSNPTWIKKARSNEERVAVDRTSAENAFLMHVEGMDALLAAEARRRRDQGPACRLEVAAADALPVKDATVSAIVTSPPYCTRIDYVVATRPELALLGCTPEEDEILRNRMTGTPTVRRECIAAQADWGNTALTLLDAVQRHESRASDGYYLKYYLQYFHSVYQALGELNRTLSRGGRAVFVVQDSFYKEVHVDLPQIFTEMGETVGWALSSRVNFKVGSNLAAINSQSREYRSSTKATESALFFAKRDYA